MIGTTGIRDLRIDCIIGIYPHERAVPQPVVLDIEMDYDFAPASSSEAIGDAVDYDQIVASVTGLIESRQFQLLETMAEQTAAMLLASVPRLQAVRLEIRKPAAVPSAAHSYARVERVRR
jgi:dihydroneopterin aldolase